MKRSNKIMILSLALSTSILSLFPIETSAQVNKELLTPVTITTITTINNSKDNISNIKAQAIGWRYKSINGKVYRRQYNYSREKWIGEWELC